MSNTKDITIVPGSFRNKVSKNNDIFIQFELNQTQNENIESDRNSGINLAQVFDDERQGSAIFRPDTKITYLYENTYTGTTNYPIYKNDLYYVDNLVWAANPTGKWGGFPQYKEFEFIRNDSENPQVNFVAKSASSYNWTFYMSYVFENDYDKTLQYYNTSISQTFPAKNGIPFQITNGTNRGQSIITFKSPVKHNLAPGEYVYLLDNAGNPLTYNGNNTFRVYSLGNGGYGSEEYIFNLYNIGYTGGTFNDGIVGTFKRIIDITTSAQTISEYYVRKHKIITNVEDAIMIKSGFEYNPFDDVRKYQFSSLTPTQKASVTQKEGNQSYNLSFNKDFNLANLRDNFKRPITELYFTIIYKGYYGWMNRTNSRNIGTRAGYGFNLVSNLTTYWNSLNVVSDSELQLETYTKVTGGTYQFYYNKDLKSGDTMFGDFCEYNSSELKERVISPYYHKITYNKNVFQIEKQPTNNPPGFYYQPHNPITLRVYSPYIEEGDPKTVADIPDYATYNQSRNVFTWRDIYTYGYIDENGNGVNYPFLNGAHYPFKNTIFRLIPEGSNYVPDNFVVQQPIIDDCQ